MNPALTLGLIAAACGCLARTRRGVGAAQVFWAIAAVAALVVFLLMPPSFAEVTLWAGAGACICLWAGQARREALPAAGIAGLLIGASTPYLAATLAPVTQVPGAMVGGGVALLALLAGAALARPAGAAMAGLTTALTLGLLSPLASGAGLAAALIVAVPVARSRPRVAAVLMLALPVLAYGGGLA